MTPTLGLVVRSKVGDEWVYVGARITSVNTTEHVFARVMPQLYWPHALRTYAASKPETLAKMFPSLEADRGPQNSVP